MLFIARRVFSLPLLRILLLYILKLDQFFCIEGKEIEKKNIYAWLCVVPESMLVVGEDLKSKELAVIMSKRKRNEGDSSESAEDDVVNLSDDDNETKESEESTSTARGQDEGTFDFFCFSNKNFMMKSI